MIGPSSRRANSNMLMYSLSFIILLSFFSCKSDKTTITQKYIESDSLINIEAIPGSEKLKVSDNTLISLSAKPINNYFIRMVNLTSNSKAVSFLRKGNGPDETDNIVPQSLSIYKGEAIFINNNAELIKLSVKNPTKGITKKQLPVEVIPPNDIKLLSDSLLIGHTASGLMNNELFTYNITSSNLQGKWEYFNKEQFSNLSKNTLYDLNYSFIEVNSENNLIASIYAKFDKLILRTLDSDSIYETIKFYEYEKPIVSDQGDIRFNDIIPFTIDTDSDEQFIYRLGFVKMTNQEIRNLTSEQMKTINTILSIYDWSGNFLHSFSLDQPIFKFDVENQILFGMNPFEDDKLYLYDLQEIY